MFTSKFIVALFAFASSTNAFYYFEPGYRCAQDEACVAAKAAKRDAVVDANAALPGYSMRVVQRPSEVTLFQALPFFGFGNTNLL